MNEQGDDTNPTWDFQWIVPQPESGKEYQLAGRLIHKLWDGRDDVRSEVKKFLAGNVR